MAVREEAPDEGIQLAMETPLHEHRATRSIVENGKIRGTAAIVTGGKG
jgi:hypothetical protein